MYWSPFSPLDSKSRNFSFVRYVRHATVVCAGNHFEMLFLGEADFGGVVAVDGQALEDIPEGTLQLLVATFGDGIAVVRAGGAVSCHRFVVYGVKQGRLLLDRSFVEGFAEKLGALFVDGGETIEKGLAFVLVGPIGEDHVDKFVDQRALGSRR